MSYNRRAVNRYAAILLFSSIAGSGLITLVWGATPGLAFGFGTMVMLLPQLFFVYRLFAMPGAGKAGKEISASDSHLAFLILMRTEGTKFVLVVVAFALVFSVRPDLPAIAVFAGAIWMMLVTTFSNIRFAGTFVQQDENRSESSHQGPTENNGD